MSPSTIVFIIEINFLAFGDFQTLCNSTNENTPSSFFLVPIILLIYSDQMRKISRHKLGDSAVFPSHLFGSPGNRHVSSRYQEDKFPPIILKQAVEERLCWQTSRALQILPEKGPIKISFPLSIHPTYTRNLLYDTWQ